jgi:hypothetical protein
VISPDIRLPPDSSDPFGRLTPAAGLSVTDMEAERRELELEAEDREVPGWVVEALWLVSELAALPSEDA